MDSEIYEDAKDWEEIAEKKYEKVLSQKEGEVCELLGKVKQLEDVHSKREQIEKLNAQLQRLGQRYDELLCDNQRLRRSFEDVDKKLRSERRKILDEKMEKERHDKFVVELRERVQIEEMERDRVRCELKRKREREREYLEFQEFKKHRK